MACAILPVSASGRLGWPDSVFTRLKALALLQTLNVELLTGRSATAVLEQWCGDHRLAADPRIQAIRDRAVEKPAPPDVREILKVSDAALIRYRRVRLACGSHSLSEADNWYVPGKLTSRMNETLESTDTPFGLVVRDLNFSRRNIGADLLWTPLEKGWELKMPALPHGNHPLAIPAYILRHRAVLSTPDNAAFSVVEETYRGELLDFRPGR